MTEIINAGRGSAVRVLPIAWLAAATMMTACAAIENAVAPAPDPDGGPGGEGLAYTFELTGVEDAQLRDLLEQSSQLVTLRDDPPATQAGLNRRAEGDRERFAAVLRSEGYYAHTLAIDIDTEATPARVVASVETGSPYRLDNFEIAYEGEVGEDFPRNAAALDLELGTRARSIAVLEAQVLALRRLGELGYPLARLLDRQSVIDRDAQTLSVALQIDAGPAGRYGDTTIEGLADVEPEFIERRIPWQRGDAYDRRQVEELRNTLLESDLFSTVSITTAETLADDGTLPVAVTVVEGAHRSIGIGANYSTSEGASVTAFWEHRNFLGQQERLRLSAEFGEIVQGLTTEFRKPGLWRLDQDLAASFALEREDTEAFESKGAEAFVGLERRLSPRWRAGAGVSFEVAEIDDRTTVDTLYLVGFPLTATRDSTDSLLDATEGTRLSLLLTPYAGEESGSLFFVESSIAAAGFQALDSDRRFVLAGRTRLGSIMGEATARLPASRRFYAGGGGSIRGYEFQSVGPLDAQNDPLGGRSVLEVGGEVRIRVTETIGIVPFVEGGTVFNTVFPDFDETMRFAGGLGARYFTAAGPIRLDVAVPINGRDIDDSFELYVSFGQAF